MAKPARPRGSRRLRTLDAHELDEVQGAGWRQWGPYLGWSLGINALGIGASVMTGDPTYMNCATMCSMAIMPAKR